MRKKIRDLTIKQITEICHAREKCFNCPLNGAPSEVCGIAEEDNEYDMEVDVNAYCALRGECDVSKWYLDHKAIKIIKEKRVDVDFLFEEWEEENYEFALENYNSNHDIELTQEEFDLLKEVLLWIKE